MKNDKGAVIRIFARKYQKAGKKEKTFLLNKIAETTGYHRKYLVYLLHNPPRKRKIKRVRISPYISVFKPLKKLWGISNYACGVRLASVIPTYLESLEKFGEIVVSLKEKELLLKISPSTIDRMLKHERRRINLKGRSRTKPGTLFKHQIPIRTFADWDNAKPGFTEIDTVHHCGDSAGGEYIHTLDTTDVSTGWNECVAFMGRSYAYTVAGLEKVKTRLPFPLLGIDFDTGGEFVNYHLIRYAEKEKITYTRAREEKKNDQAYVEQQNYSVVRRFVGYGRLDTWEQLKILNQLYEKLSDYQNFFQPVMRLREKHRDGARVTRRYDKPKTPYQRVIEHSNIPDETKKKLKERFEKLNPKALLEEITRLGRKLYRR